jgi:glycosyltransferase involved in cell wall biosynthesis
MNAAPPFRLVYGNRSAPAPLLTFGIPAFNRPALLREALAGIAAQTGAPDYEVVVCDDGNLPETARVVAEFPADRFSLHLNRPALGPVGNWNRCLELARGRWVTILHEDDTLYPWYLATVRPRLRDGVAAVCTQVATGPVPPAAIPPAGSAAVRPYPPLYFIKSSMTPFPGVLFQRELGLRLGGFDERQGPLADYDFWYRLACAGRIEVLRQIAAFYRVAEGQWTERAWPEMLRRTHLLRLRIAREQLGRRPLARWLARFFTYRNALSYAKRFPEKPAALARALRFKHIPGSFVPSGWVWSALRFSASRRSDSP